MSRIRRKHGQLPEFYGTTSELIESAKFIQNAEFKLIIPV